MKHISILKINSLLICSVLISACSKEDDNLLKGSPDVYSSIYMPQAINAPALHQFDFSSQPDSILYGANFGGPDVLSSDMEVHFAADTSLVSEFNAANFTNYKAMPSGSFAFEKNTAVLKKDKNRTDALNLKIFTDKLDGTGGYLLPVSLSANGNVSVNQKLKTSYFLIKAVYTANPFIPFDNSQWNIVSFSSDEKTGEGLTNGQTKFAFDKNNATFWTTEWKNAKPGPPHFVIVDMQEEKKIRGFIITGRRDASGQVKTTGNPRDIIVETSKDGISWTYSQSVSLPNLLENTVYLNYAQTAKFFKITINTSQGDTYLTHIAELTAF